MQDGASALFLASQNGHLALVELLMAAGAVINDQNFDVDGEKNVSDSKGLNTSTYGAYSRVCACMRARARVSEAL